MHLERSRDRCEQERLRFAEHAVEEFAKVWPTLSGCYWVQFFDGRWGIFIIIIIVVVVVVAVVVVVVVVDVIVMLGRRR